MNQVKIKYELEEDNVRIQPALGRGISRACVYRIGVYMRHEERYWVWLQRADGALSDPCPCFRITVFIICLTYKLIQMVETRN